MIDPPRAAPDDPPAACRRHRTWLVGVVSVALLLCCAMPAGAGSEEAEAEYERAAEAMRAGDSDTAEAALLRAVEIDPGFAKGWMRLGMMRSGALDREGAIEAFGRVVDLEPDNARALNNLANVYFRQGDHEEAARWYARAVEADPEYLLAAFHYGWMLRELNRPEEAERWFGRCMDLEATTDRERKTRLDCLYYFGSLRFRARDYETAASIMERVLAVNRIHPEARYYLGMSYRQLGRLEEAQQQLELHNKMVHALRNADTIEKQPDP